MRSASRSNPSTSRSQRLRQRSEEKERFETRVVKIKDERAGLAVEGEDGEKYFSGLTDFATYEKKISVIVGAEKERQQLEKLIAQRRGLTGLER